MYKYVCNKNYSSQMNFENINKNTLFVVMYIVNFSSTEGLLKYELIYFHLKYLID